MSMDWQDHDLYQHLRDADRSAFAWEWLRRSSVYVEAWARYGRNAQYAPIARRFGLERFENPRLGTPHARAIWTANVDPSVIRAKVVGSLAEEQDWIDLRVLSGFVTLTVDQNDIEHILLSDGFRNLRIDVLDGTLIGCPSALAYRIQGLSEITGSTAILRRLKRLTGRGRFDRVSRGGRRDRWILELRVADALSSGASHQDIARVLFPEAISRTRWRDSDAYRQRVQRLARMARVRMQDSPDPRWFDVK